MAFESIVPTPVSPKTLAALVFSAGSHAQARWRRGTNAFRRQILPTSLPGINHTGSGSRYSGTDLSGGINRNVMGRTEPHLRQHRQSPADRRRFVHRQRRRLTPKCSVNWIFAGHFDCRCADRSSRGGRSEGAQETGPRQRPQRTRRPRYPQAWTARRKRGPINARTPQGGIRGPDREVRGCRAGYGSSAKSTCVLRSSWRRLGSARPRA